MTEHVLILLLQRGIEKKVPERRFFQRREFFNHVGIFFFIIHRSSPRQTLQRFQSIPDGKGNPVAIQMAESS